MERVKMAFITILALMIGGAVNMGIIELNSALFPIKGYDMTKVEDINRAIKTFPVWRFIMPFLAHAAGTFVGAFLVGRFLKRRAKLAAGIIGAVFFYGGYAAVKMIQAPLWFDLTDLLLAYFPMAYLGYVFGRYQFLKSDKTAQKASAL